MFCGCVGLIILQTKRGIVWARFQLFPSFLTCLGAKFTTSLLIQRYMVWPWDKMRLWKKRGEARKIRKMWQNHLWQKISGVTSYVRSSSEGLCVWQGLLAYACVGFCAVWGVGIRISVQFCTCSSFMMFHGCCPYHSMSDFESKVPSHSDGRACRRSPSI